MFADKILLIQLQTFFSLIWSFLLRLIEFTRFFSLSLVLITLFIYFELWPQKTFLKIFLIVGFAIFNGYFLYKILQETKNNYWPSISQVRKKFEFELKLLNNELILFFDKLANFRTGVLDGSKAELWEIFQKKNKLIIYSNYKFRFKYFLLNSFKVSNFTKISFIGWIIFFIFMGRESFYREFSKSILIEKTASGNFVDFSTNTWVFPPLSSKREVIFFEHKNTRSKETIEKKSVFLLESGSKIQMNFFNVAIRDIRIKFFDKKDKRAKFIKKFSVIDNNTIRFEKTLEEGEYIIFIKKKIFQKIIINFDAPPQVSFESDLDINENKLKFSYRLFDENNKKLWLELSLKKSFLENRTDPNLEFLNKIYSKPIHYLEVNNNVLRTKKSQDKKDKSFVENIFIRNISYLPILGNEIFMRLRSIDENNQLGESEIKSIHILKEVFLDPVSISLIRIRQDLFLNEKINKTKLQLRELLSKIKELQIKNRVLSLVSILEDKNLSELERMEKSLFEIWRLAIFLENINLENLEKRISILKKELETLIKNNNKEDLIRAKMNELELLLKKYEDLTKSELEESDKINHSKKSNDLDKLVSDNDKTFKKKLQELLNRADRLLNKRKLNKETSRILGTINEIYQDQKLLIEESHNYKELNEDIEKFLGKQKKILKKYKKITKNIKKIIPEESSLIDNVENEMKEVKKKIEDSQVSESLNSQIDILSSIEDLYKKLKNKSKVKRNKEQEKEIRQNNGNYKPSEKKYDVPIIFERNELDLIINKIREMTNEQNRDNREKKYLKRLLPKF